MNRERILVVSSDVVGQAMAGPAIRATELARVLAQRFDVLVAAPNDEPVDGLEVVSFRNRPLKYLVEDAKVVISQGIGVPLPPLLKPGHSLVIDWYDPNPVEVVAHHRDSSQRLARRSQEYLRRQLSVLAKRADHFLYATPRQRDFWIGMLAAEGRLSWEADRSHPNLDDLLSLVPFGLPREEPKATRPALKGVWPGIGRDDIVLLWGGGIWNWFDPLTVIKAVGRAAAVRPEIKLFFMGVKHPNPNLSEMSMVGRAVDLARELDLMDKQVFFNFGWVDYAERVNYLLEADMAVMAAGQDLETHLSFRTRLLDSLWAGLPMIISEGDYFADLVMDCDLGRVFPVGDDKAMATAILELAGNPDRLAQCRSGIGEAAADFTWPRVAGPLVEFCARPRFHPGAVHSRNGYHALVARYALGAADVVIRFGGLDRVINRILRRD